MAWPFRAGEFARWRREWMTMTMRLWWFDNLNDCVYCLIIRNEYARKQKQKKMKKKMLKKTKRELSSEKKLAKPNQVRPFSLNCCATWLIAWWAELMAMKVCAATTNSVFNQTFDGFMEARWGGGSTFSANHRGRSNPTDWTWIHDSPSTLNPVNNMLDLPWIEL